MRFKVYGAKRDTGENTTVLVEAATAVEAVAKANRHGILVERYEHLPADGPAERRRAPSLPPAQASDHSASAAKDEVDDASPVPAGRTSRHGGFRLVATTLLLPIAIFVTAYVLWIQPRDEARRRATREAVAPVLAAAEVGPKSQADEVAALREKLRSLGVDPNAPASAAVVPAESPEKKAKLVALKGYAESCDAFVREAKSLRARVQNGVTFDQYSDKMQTFLDAYSEVPAAPDDERARDFATAAERLVSLHKLAFDRWRTALEVRRVSGSRMPYERDLQRDWASADIAATAMINALTAVRTAE